MKFKKLIWCFVFVIGITRIQAQETIPATGGNASGSGGSVSYSVGQIVYTTNTGTNGSMAQGVQQPYEISVIIGVEENNAITLQCMVYPNPAVDYVILNIENIPLSALYFQLFDINGKLLKKQKIYNAETKISFIGLPPATYILKVVKLQGFVSRKDMKTFKIVKN